MCDRARRPRARAPVNPSPQATLRGAARGPSRRREETIQNCDPRQAERCSPVVRDHARRTMSSRGRRTSRMFHARIARLPQPRLPAYRTARSLLLFRRCDGCCIPLVRSACSRLVLRPFTLFCSIIVACRHVETRGARARRGIAVGTNPYSAPRFTPSRVLVSTTRAVFEC